MLVSSAVSLRNGSASLRDLEMTKANLALLEASPPISQSSKPFQLKNKGLVAKTFDWGKEEVSNDEEETRIQVLMALTDDELSMGKNHACNDEWIDIPIKNGASASSKVMTLTYQDHSSRERSGLGTMKHTKPETQESSNTNVSGPVTVSNLESVTSLVPTNVRTND
nr:retrovirus-related Pol polyprotein from transposon TNT 1-94 [Tanacetum cinerariifolium]